MMVLTVGIQFITTAVGMPGDCHYLNIRLQLEQQRLISWGEVSGLLDMSSGKCNRGTFEETFGEAMSNLVLDQLMQVKQLVNEFEKWQLMYIGDRSDSSNKDIEARPATGLPPEILNEQDQIKKFPRRNKLLARALRGICEVKHAPKYFAWAS